MACHFGVFASRALPATAHLLDSSEICMHEKFKLLTTFKCNVLYTHNKAANSQAVKHISF